MKEVDASGCRVHVLVCTNERKDGMVSCKPVGGYDLYLALKDRARAAGIRATHWVTRTGCLGWCNAVGTTVCIERRGEAPRWFAEVTPADLERIWDAIVR
jgi:(2Fe-2S) ferredoxin